MSTYYLLDMHVPSIADARIVDVISTSMPGAEFRVDGLTPVRIPDGVRVEDPVDLEDLLAQKYVGLLARYPGFTQIIFDDLLDGADIVALNMTKAGSRSTVGGTFQTTPIDVSAATSSVTQCVLVYEHYTWRYVDPKNGRIERYYVEEPEEADGARVSVNNGSNFNLTTSGSLVAVEPSERGSQVVVGLLSTHPLDLATNRRLVNTGSWALIF